MSAGIIWYKTQPNSRLSKAVGDLLTDYCGSIRSHHVTVQPGRIAPLLSENFLRCENVIIIGGFECRKPEENIVFVLARALSIPLEVKYLSRSRFCYDSFRDLRLPSLEGAILFPTQPGCPEGFLLSAGTQHILVLPSQYRPAVSAAVSMREFFVPEVARRKRAAAARAAPANDGQKDYVKFKRNSRASPVTRVYDEKQLIDKMERALWRVREDSPEDASFDYMVDDSNRGSS